MHILITGGAGYIGSALTSSLLEQNHVVTVVDSLLFGGDALLAHCHHSRFRFVPGSAGDLPDDALSGVDAVVHLAALVGFPACSEAGHDTVWRENVETTERVMEACERAGVRTLVFSSTYSNYGVSPDGLPVTEDSPLFPQSSYAESKIAAEQYLLNRAHGGCRCAPVILRFATLFGLSPRMRFDLIVNQFVLEAIASHELTLYGADQRRAFVHIRDVCRAIILSLEAPRDLVTGEVFNVGSEDESYTKAQVAELVRKHVSGLTVTHATAQFDADMRDISVSFEKVRRRLAFWPTVTVEDGIVEIRNAVLSGLIRNPQAAAFRNAAPLLPSR